MTAHADPEVVAAVIRREIARWVERAQSDIAVCAYGSDALARDAAGERVIKAVAGIRKAQADLAVISEVIRTR